MDKSFDGMHEKYDFDFDFDDRNISITSNDKLHNMYSRILVYL